MSKMYAALFAGERTVIETVCKGYVYALGCDVALPISDFEIIRELPFDLWNKEVGIKRVCPSCGGPLALLSSINLKKCGDCAKEFPWNLDEGQKVII